MRRLGEDIRAHPAVAGPFLALWAIAWWITVVTFNRGVPNEVVLLHLALVLAAGGIVGWWRQESLRATSRQLLLAAGCAAAAGLLAVPLPDPLRFALAGLALPVVATIAGVRGLGGSAIVGLLVLEIDMAIEVARWPIGEALGLVGLPGEADLLEGAAEAVAFFLVAAGLGLPLGWTGGLIAALLARGRRRLRPSGGPTSLAWK